jgi:hypothetical protein
VWGKHCFYPDDERRFDEGGIHLFVPGRTVDIPVGESRDNAGIWQPVELFATGSAYVEDLDVRADDGPRPHVHPRAEHRAGIDEGARVHARGGHRSTTRAIMSASAAS